MWYNDNMTKLNKLIKIRKENKVKLREIAKVLDSSIAYYQMLESGKRKLYYEDAVKIAKFFNMKPDDLFLD